MLRERGTKLILGLRDIMDEPAQLAPEWKRKKAMPALRDLYDQIWVYGLPEIADPLEGLEVPESVRSKMIYTGYLHRSLPSGPAQTTPLNKIDSPYILVTTGGGGDGDAVVDWVLKAYEKDKKLPYPALLVLGPFMRSDKQAEYLKRVDALENVEAITFDAQMEHLVSRAIAVVAMGGYNTFCEILSFNKRALIVPRTKPRMEQHLRATRAAGLNLISMLKDDGKRDAKKMAAALHHLPQQEEPQSIIVPGLMDGLNNINRLVTQMIRPRGTQRLKLTGKRT